MISDTERGFAWTNAVLGLQSKEIHICGDERALKLINKFCNLTGDTLEKIKYNRFSKLIVEKTPFDLTKDLKKGDCIINFNTRKLHDLKKTINDTYGVNGENICSIIYGKLPPETRVSQATSFNNPHSNIQFLVATDAIGMGMNLSIRRIIFTSLKKNFGGKDKDLDDYQIKQIAGRAGRYQSTGYVNTMSLKDNKTVFKILMDDEIQNEISKFEDSSDENNFSSKESLIKKGGLFPTYEQIEKFYSYYKITFPKKEKFSLIFQKFISICLIEKNYFLSNFDDFILISDLIEDVELRLEDHYNFSLAPISIRKKRKNALTCFKEYAIMFK